MVRSETINRFNNLIECLINKMSSTSVALQVDDTGKSALDYAREAGQQSTWLLLWQNHQERHSKNKALAVPTCCDQWGIHSTYKYAQYLSSAEGRSKRLGVKGTGAQS